jgi:hypothetical protein
MASQSDRPVTHRARARKACSCRHLDERDFHRAIDVARVGLGDERRDATSAVAPRPKASEDSSRRRDDVRKRRRPRAMSRIRGLSGSRVKQSPDKGLRARSRR